MAKMLDRTQGVAGTATEVTVKLNLADSPLLRINEIGFSETVGCYRELVDLEIGRASEYGARWWSRRLVEMYEDAGFVRLDK